MTKSSRFSRRLPLLVGLTAALLVLALLASCSYIYASHTGDEFEHRLTAAKKLESADFPRLRAELAQLAADPEFTESQVNRVLMLEQRRLGPQGVELLARELSAASPNRHDASPGLSNALYGTLKSYHREQFKHQRELQRVQKAYRERLNHGWLGWWMRLAGYPTSNAKKPEKLRTVAGRAG
jgi:hypothetical protein